MNTNRMIVGLMVTKNEANRYLASCLDWHRNLLDAIAVVDDTSDDGTGDVARRYGAVVFTRPEGVGSFLEHEGRFRTYAMSALEVLGVRDGDWVLALDADEFLVSNGEPARANLEEFIDAAEAEDKNAVSVMIPEVWEATTSPAQVLTEPKVRIDGWWNSNRAPRLWRYARGAAAADKRMGCGSAPVYVSSSTSWPAPAERLELLHYGYATKEDRYLRYRRYTAMRNHGHNQSHIESIIREPDLMAYARRYPHVYRGN